jgi:hypothetical protein
MKEGYGMGKEQNPQDEIALKRYKIISPILSAISSAQMKLYRKPGVAA